MNRARRPHVALRFVRGGSLAVSSTALAVTAHAAARGDLPDTALTLLLTALVGWIATALAGKARGPFGTLVLLGTAQLVMHLVLTTLSMHDMQMGPPDADGGLSMFAAHAVATVLTALLVAKADAMLLAVLSVLRAVLPWLLTPLPVAVAAPTRLPALPARTPHLIGVDLRSIHGRRGPPEGS